MRIIGSLILVLASTACQARPQVERLHPDYGLNVLELVEKHGYSLERHTVETSDGYLLEVHRIPSKNGTGNPVLVMHGLCSSSADWVNAGPGKGLGYVLHEQGYDVWLGNARGTRWGRQHKTLDPDHDKEHFWDFSWHEIGMYDLPAIIDYILADTKTDRLHYIGHSQGTTAYFVMAAERPEYNDKIKLMSALGPTVYMDNTRNLFAKLLAQHEESIEWITKFIGMYEFLPSSELSAAIGKEYCDDEAELKELCRHIIFLIAGYDSQQLNTTFIPVLLTNFPAGTSTKQFLHYAQGFKNGGFRKYDYRAEKNMEKYGQPTPPDYDLSKLTAPIALYYGQNDMLTNYIDVENFRDNLSNVVVDNKIAYKAFNHLDFLWANDVVDLLYSDVIADMAKYN